MVILVIEQIYSVVGNWGWANVLLTAALKLVFYHLSATSYRSMAKNAVTAASF